MMLPRRTFLKNLGLLIAAPAIVKVSSLMPVKALVEDAVPVFQSYPGGFVVYFDRRFWNTGPQEITFSENLGPHLWA